MNSLNFSIKVSTDAYSRDMNVKDWPAIARRIAKAAKGRSKTRRVIVWAGDSYLQVDASGKVSTSLDVSKERG